MNRRFGDSARALGFVALLAIPLTFLALEAEAGGTSEKVTICHAPPGDPANAHTITVGAAAVAAHLAHGDTAGACAATCGDDGSSCLDNVECCSGLCLDGVCDTPCLQNGNDCAGGGECCSGLCEAGICATPCLAEEAQCTSGNDCCSGNCSDGTCVAACRVDDSPCETGNDCCSGICTDTSKTCASDCTIGPELNGPECHTGLDCCESQGVCILGLCYVETMCADIGEACQIEEDPATFCCFDNVCLNGVCIAP